MKRNHYFIEYLVFATIALFSVVCHCRDSTKSDDSTTSIENIAQTNLPALDTQTSLIAYGEYVDGRIKKRKGVVYAVVGGGAFVPGSVMVLMNIAGAATNDIAYLGLPFLIAGAISLTVGMVMAITGSRKKEKYKKLIDTPVLSLSANTEGSKRIQGISAFANYYF